MEEVKRSEKRCVDWEWINFRRIPPIIISIEMEGYDEIKLGDE